MPYDGKPKSDFMATVRARFTQAIEARSVNVASQLDDIRFAAGSPDNNWQWPEAVLNARLRDPSGARPCLTINKIPQHIKQVTNDQRQNRPAIKVLPVDDKSDPEVAEVLNGIIRHIEVNSDADVAYDTACENQVTHGEGYFRILTDYVDEMSFEQDIQIKRIRNSFSVYMDPHIKDPSGADQEWCFITEVIPKTEYEAQYKSNPINFDVAGLGDDMRHWINDDGVRIAEYFCFKDETKKLLLWSDGTVTLDDRPPHIPVVEKPLKERDTVIRKVMWSKLNGVDVIEEREWAGKFIPVIRVVGNEFDVEGKLVVSGIVRNAKDAQRMFNYWKSQEAEILALAPKAPFMAPVEGISDYEDFYKAANRQSFAYLPFHAYTTDGKPIPMPVRSQPPLPPQGFIAAAMGAADDIKGATGQYNPSLGQEGQAKSGVAIRTEQLKSDTGTFHYIDNLSRAIRHCGRILVDLIPKIYDTRRVARIIGEDDEPDQAILDPSIQEPVMVRKNEEGKEIDRIYNPGIGRYDVVVTVGPSFTTKRQEAMQAMSEMTSQNPQLWQVIGDLLVKNMDWPGADEMAKRLKAMLLPQVQALEQNDEDPEAIKAKAAQVQQAAVMLQQKAAEVQQREAQVTEGEHKLAVADARFKQSVAEQAAEEAQEQVKAHQEMLSRVTMPMTGENGSQMMDMAQMQMTTCQQLAQLIEVLTAQAQVQAAPRQRTAVITDNPDGSMTMREVETI